MRKVETSVASSSSCGNYWHPPRTSSTVRRLRLRVIRRCQRERRKRKKKKKKISLSRCRIYFSHFLVALEEKFDWRLGTFQLEETETKGYAYLVTHKVEIGGPTTTTTSAAAAALLVIVVLFFSAAEKCNTKLNSTRDDLPKVFFFSLFVSLCVCVEIRSLWDEGEKNKLDATTTTTTTNAFEWRESPYAYCTVLCSRLRRRERASQC